MTRRNEEQALLLPEGQRTDILGIPNMIDQQIGAGDCSWADGEGWDEGGVRG